MKLEKWLNDNAVNRSKFCEELGISRTHLYDILLGERMPSAKLAKQIENATNGSVTAMELLYPEEFKNDR